LIYSIKKDIKGEHKVVSNYYSIKPIENDNSSSASNQIQIENSNPIVNNQIENSNHVINNPSVNNQIELVEHDNINNSLNYIQPATQTNQNFQNTQTRSSIPNEIQIEENSNEFVKIPKKEYYESINSLKNILNILCIPCDNIDKNNFNENLKRINNKMENFIKYPNKNVENVANLIIKNKILTKNHPWLY
jgi:hypothetical protein